MSVTGRVTPATLATSATILHGGVGGSCIKKEIIMFTDVLLYDIANSSENIVIVLTTYDKLFADMGLCDCTVVMISGSDEMLFAILQFLVCMLNIHFII